MWVTVTTLRRDHVHRYLHVKGMLSFSTKGQNTATSNCFSDSFTLQYYCILYADMTLSWWSHSFHPNLTLEGSLDCTRWWRGRWWWLRWFLLLRHQWFPRPVIWITVLVPRRAKREEKCLLHSTWNNVINLLSPYCDVLAHGIHSVWCNFFLFWGEEEERGLIQFVILHWNDQITATCNHITVLPRHLVVFIHIDILNTDFCADFHVKQLSLALCNTS